jgi:diguanylate cyclase (GGDEF)-like protein/PAS domain S-box-containing protein
METDNPIRILFVEDVPSDAEIAARELQKGGIQFTSARVDTKEAFLKALEEFQPDVIISDYTMPEFDGMQALKLAKEYAATIPFIILTGSINEATAVECMKAGTTDYILKDRIVRLPFAVQEAFERMKDKKEKKAARQALRESEERYRFLFNGILDAVYVHEVSVEKPGKFIAVNDGACSMLGYTMDEFLQMEVKDIDIPEQSEKIPSIHEKLYRDGYALFETCHVAKDGRRIPVEINIKLFELQDKSMVLSVARDITDRKRVEAEREKLLQDLGERVKEFGCIADISRLAEKPWVSIEEFVQQAVNILPPAWQYPEICCARIMLDSKEFKTANFRETEWGQSSDIKVDRKKFGAVTICYLEEKPAADEGPFLREERGLINTVAEFLGHIIQHRLSEAEIRASEEKLKYLAYYDTLTGLPNRNLFLERINEEIAEAKDSSSSIAVVITDINKFKSIYDIYGSKVGDRVLKEVAERLSTAIRKGDIAAHLGNDEFGIACMGITGSDDIIMLEKIIKDISYPLKIDGDEIILTFSTGISLYPHDGENASELLKSAGLALSIAEKEGRKTYQFYSKDMTVTAAEVLLLEKQLMEAIKNEEFILHYQPYWDITTKKMVGMEALVRWQSQDKGLVPPGKFIPVLEDTGMIIEVGEWILREAMRQVKEWQNNGYPVVPVSVNMSLVQFRQKDLAGMVKKIMKDSGYYPSLLTLEITESAFMQDIEFTKSVLTAMKELGCSVSIDDFGTGYSSLAYLKRLPVDNLKIDISFIREMVKDPDSASIVMAIINMAHTLNLKTIAEGIETEEQWNFLRLLRCDMGQGFYLSKPLPAQEIERFFEQ